MPFARTGAISHGNEPPARTLNELEQADAMQVTRHKAMYFGGHNVRADGDTFLRLPSMNAQRADVIGELHEIITLASGTDFAVPCVVLHHWTMEKAPHAIEGLPRSTAPPTPSCVPIGAHSSISAHRLRTSYSTLVASPSACSTLS